MDLGVDLTAVTSSATTTLASFGTIIALGIGIAMAVGVVKKLIRTK